MDYARMIRSRKGVDWRIHLTPDDMELVSRHVDLDQWYPMEVFERLLEVTGGRSIRADFLTRRWTGDPTTSIQLQWRMAGRPSGS